MTTATINYTGPNPLTFSPASLASSTSFVGGREITEVSNVTDKFMNVEVEGFVTTGTTPTADTYIKLYAWGSHTAPSVAALDVIAGLDAGRTFTSTEIQNSILTLVRSVKVNATSDQKYHFKPFTLADIFGEMPKFWGLFVAHNTVAALSATAGNHELQYTGIKFDSA